LLIDSRAAKTAGGTGVAYDWGLAAGTVFQNAKERKLVVAGGLTPDNVAEAIAALRPWGVDVVSGVEAEPGRKDPLKVREFVKRARAADLSSVE
jgi:phosphoribosylanthranilate isomerase